MFQITIYSYTLYVSYLSNTRSHNRERRLLVLGCARTHDMGQFFYFQNKLRHPDVIYPRTCRGFSRGCCHIAGSNIESCQFLLRIFHCAMAGNKEPGLFYVLLCPQLMEKCVFIHTYIHSGSKVSLISRCEQIISARSSCKRKLLCLFCRKKGM